MPINALKLRRQTLQNRSLRQADPSFPKRDNWSVSWLSPLSQSLGVSPSAVPEGSSRTTAQITVLNIHTNNVTFEPPARILYAHTLPNLCLMTAYLSSRRLFLQNYHVQEVIYLSVSYLHQWKNGFKYFSNNNKTKKNPQTNSKIRPK